MDHILNYPELPMIKNQSFWHKWARSLAKNERVPVRNLVSDPRSRSRLCSFFGRRTHSWSSLTLHSFFATIEYCCNFFLLSLQFFINKNVREFSEDRDEFKKRMCSRLRSQSQHECSERVLFRMRSLQL